MERIIQMLMEVKERNDQWERSFGIRPPLQPGDDQPQQLGHQTGQSQPVDVPQQRQPGDQPRQGQHPEDQSHQQRCGKPPQQLQRSAGVKDRHVTPKRPANHTGFKELDIQIVPVTNTFGRVRLIF